MRPLLLGTLAMIQYYLAITDNVKIISRFVFVPACPYYLGVIKIAELFIATGTLCAEYIK